jgi:DNA polymerase III epsilon subunit-like protein
MVVHHITDKIVQNKPPFMGSDECAKLQKLVSDRDNVIVAHNAQFDMLMLNMEGIFSSRIICTLKLARYLDKNGVIPKYNLQYLRYFLGLDIDARAHDALGDVLVLEGLFNRLKAKFQQNDKLKDPVAEMIRISNNPVLIPRMPFGKHKGMLFTQVPQDYLQWLSGTELGEDMEYTVITHLRRLSEN